MQIHISQMSALLYERLLYLFNFKVFMLHKLTVISECLLPDPLLKRQSYAVFHGVYVVSSVGLLENATFMMVLADVGPYPSDW